MRKKRNALSQGLRFDVFRRDNFRCVYCGRSSPSVTLECDHRTPVSKGGSDTIDNLVTACHDCNRGKSAKDVPAVKPQAGLVGLFGHLPLDGGDYNQFEIISADNGMTALQLFSWLDGRPTEVKLLPDLTIMEKAKLYRSEAEWISAGDEILRRGRA